MFKDDAATISNVCREDENLADLVEEIATSALRGVQLDVRSVYCTARQNFGADFPKIPDVDLNPVMSDLFYLNPEA